MIGTIMADKKSSNGIFVASYYAVAESSDCYTAINSLFDPLEWPSKTLTQRHLRPVG